MNQITISYKNKTNLIKKLELQENIKTLEEKKGLLNKFISSSKEYANIHFHSGIIDENSVDIAKNVKKLIVPSLTLKEEFINEYSIDSDKIEVVYPSIDIEYEKPKIVKELVCDKLEINPKKRIILFTAKNIKNSGVKEFIETIFSLNEDNYIGIIAADSKQIYNLKFQLSKFNYSNKLLLVEDYDNMDELFLASDIFLLPTHNKSFATNILKAMYCKCAVFTTVNNDAKELVDVFSTMESPSDRSTPFKVDALLMENNELKKIKKQNRKVAKEYTLEKNLDKVNQIIQAV